MGDRVRKRGGRVAKPRVCAYCQAPLAERRPVYLLATTAGTIVGPYHAGCAERVVLVGKKHPIVAITEAEKASAYGFMAREETLPW